MSAPIYTRVRSTIIKTLLVFAQGELKRPKKLEQVKNISDDISGIIDDVSDDISDVSDGITYGINDGVGDVNISVKIMKIPLFPRISLSI